MSTNCLVSGVGYDSYYNWFQETIQNMFDHMPSNLVDMPYSPAEGAELASYEAFAQEMHPDFLGPKSKRRQYIEQCRAARSYRRI